MRIFSFLFLIFAGVFFQQAEGQNCQISGIGNGYAGIELRLYKLSDPISKNLIPLARATADQEGRFIFNIPIRETETVFINAGIFSFYIYASPGNVYDLILPDLILKTAEEEQDAFFNYVKVIPEVANIPSDVNNLIRTFDAEFDPVFNRVADRVMYNVKLDEIPSLIEKLNRLSSIPGATDFYRDFVSFRLIMLNRVASGDYPGRIEDSILINRRFAPENPAYLDLIEQIFTGYLKNLSGGTSKDLFIKAVAASSLDSLKKIIMDDGKASNTELQEFIILLNLYPAWYDGSIPHENVMKLIMAINSSGSSQFLKDLSSVLAGRLLMLSRSTVPPDFRLTGIDGRQYSPEYFLGKFLLISFSRSDNSFSLAEYGIMNNWLGRYNQKVQVVTILRDNDFRKGASKLADYGFSWTILDGSSADMLEYLYDVRLYPSFLLVDPSGRILIKNCPFPSENLEALLRKLTAGE